MDSVLKNRYGRNGWKCLTSHNQSMYPDASKDGAMADRLFNGTETVGEK